MTEARTRPAWAEIDLDAIRHNARALLALAHPAALCAVVKADGYGHGAVAVARAALEAGATRLAVAVVEEGVALREAGISAPVLLLSEPSSAEAMADAVAAHLTPTLYTLAGVAAAEAAVGRRHPVAVEVKVDTGMHRVGGTPDDVLAVSEAVARSPQLELAGLWTHLAVADEPDNPYTDSQLERFEEVRDKLAAAGLLPELLHAANSAGAIVHPGARYDMVRCGIALYGHAPAAAVDALGLVDLRPALSLKAEVTFVKELEAGERVSYGLRWTAPAPTTVATVPLGYADGVPRRWFDMGGCVLIDGVRRPIAGTVTMDQILVDCGPGSTVRVGDEVVLLGRQRDEEIRAEDWAEALGTISYEVLCGIGPRVRRVYVPSVPAARQGVLG
ncbi:MAG TPA: alanine racemase [Acidimicrobiales bacterium]|nr:alanine racemase [Acidimicrobiales bacterium]